VGGILAAGHVAATVTGYSNTTLLFLFGLFLGALWRPAAAIAAIIIAINVISHIHTTNYPGGAVLILVLVFAVVGVVIGGPLALRHLGQHDYNVRLGNIRGISGIWHFWG
jgi:hypothetical protein